MSGWAQTSPQPKAQPHSPAPPSSAADKEPWDYSLTVDGYIIEGEDGYASPTFTADHNWLHLEARYNYENFRTGSLWAGYNFSWGKTWQFSVTPMIGGVFGRTNGIAPGCEASLSVEEADLLHRQRIRLRHDRRSLATSTTPGRRSPTSRWTG